MADTEMDHAYLMRLWAGWRLPAFGSGSGSDGLPHADLDRASGKSVFETIEQSGLPDDQTYVVWRGQRTFAILNVFPYSSGHLMVLPLVAAASIHDLDEDTHTELWQTVRLASRAVEAGFGPEGMNIGINEGTAGGGSVPEHLHVHVVPRWSADTNFMTSVADTRVLPETLVDTWHRLRMAWPLA